MTSIPKRAYTIGADVGMGLRASQARRNDSDPSVAQILDSQMRQVAVWRGVVHPDYFARVLVALGYHYNSATIAPERNNHGLVTCVKLRDLDYPYLYTDTWKARWRRRRTRSTSASSRASAPSP
jgi:hypothetical protein